MLAKLLYGMAFFPVAVVAVVVVVDLAVAYTYKYKYNLVFTVGHSHIFDAEKVILAFVHA